MANQWQVDADLKAGSRTQRELDRTDGGALGGSGIGGALQLVPPVPPELNLL